MWKCFVCISYERCLLYTYNLNEYTRIHTSICLFTSRDANKPYCISFLKSWFKWLHVSRTCFAQLARTVLGFLRILHQYCYNFKVVFLNVAKDCQYAAVLANFSVVCFMLRFIIWEIQTIHVILHSGSSS